MRNRHRLKGKVFKMEKVRFSIVLPCYNEAKNIPLVIERFSKFAFRRDFELILVNNGSTDNSAQVLDVALEDSANGFLRVVSIEKNIGYGHGIYYGLSNARGNTLAYSHADIQTPPEDVFKALDLITSGEVDISRAVIKGYRVNRDKENFLTIWLTKAVKMIIGVHLIDINGQPKVFSRDFFETFHNPPKDFSFDVYVLYMAHLNGFNLYTFNVDFGRRLHGESKWAGTILIRYKTILEYLKSIFFMSWRNRNRKDNPIGQLLRFLVSGIFTNLANYLAFIVTYRLLAFYYVISSVVGFFTGFVVGFVLNRIYTFGSQSRNIPGEMIKFFVVNLVSLGVNIATIYLLVDNLKIRAEFSQVVAIITSAIANFLGYKFYVFSHGGEYAGSGIEG
ncbi:glycosyltransferase [Candidatus Gottesmanbacteria bacterium]|nr:glycosyltransferase [Candidatus Gottesmanbacteria bacterium]